MARYKDSNVAKAEVREHLSHPQLFFFYFQTHVFKHNRRGHKLSRCYNDLPPLWQSKEISTKDTTCMAVV